MSRPRGERWLPLALLLASALISGFTIRRGIQPHDEGLALQWAARIAHGDWPYRDFWMNYGPGQPALLAVLVKLFGPSLLWWRIVRVGVDAGCALLVFALVRREAGTRWALAAWLAAAVVLAFPSGPGPTPPALALALLALLLAPRRPVVAGGLAGLASLFRPELGVAAALGAAIAAPDRRAALRALGAAALTTVVVWAPWFVVAPGKLLDQVLGFAGIQDLQRLPFPLHLQGSLGPAHVLTFYEPLVAMLGLVAWLAALAVRRRAPRGAWALVPLGIAGAAYLLGRTDEFHLVPLAVLVPAGLALTAARAPRALAIPLAAGIALLALAGLSRRGDQLLHPPDLRPLHLAVADGVRVTPADAAALPRLAAYVHARVPPGDPIWVADPRHDRVRVGDTLLYVLLDRPDPTRYDTMQPGVITTARVQREIVASLERARPRLIVRWLDPAAMHREPNGSGRERGAGILDAYLRSRYARSTRFGVYAVLRRRGKPGA